MARLAALFLVTLTVCGAVLAQQQPQQQQQEQLPTPEGRTELPVRPIRARQRFRPRPVRPQNRVDIVRPRRPAQVTDWGATFIRSKKQKNKGQDLRQYIYSIIFLS